MSVERAIEAPVGPRELCSALRRGDGPTVYLEGSGAADEGWAPRVALEVAPVLRWTRAGADDVPPLDRVDALVRERRERGGGAATGIVALLGFDLLARGRRPPSRAAVPDLVVLAVDASVTFPPGGTPRLTVRPRRDGERLTAADRLGRALDRIESASNPEPAVGEDPTPRPAVASLGREAYLRAVGVVKEHIRRGDIYQANLTRQFTVDHDGDAFELFRRLVHTLPAPHAAFVEDGDVAVASVSPETFLRVTADGEAETRPIKGTRPRGRTAAEDRALARELVASAKDRAELLMIVDLERNDLGRVSRTGSVRVSELAELRSYPAVHHLVARVHGTVGRELPPGELLRATFPGGSVTGAPKTRALEILRGLEPVARNFYTGSLVWFGDDGSIDSSILIRTVVLSGGRAHLGSGGGVVADSDAEGEWTEANHKARHLAEALGFSPEEAI